MKNIRKLLGYLSPYKSKIALYLLLSVLAVVFSVFSFSMLMPVLQVIFIGVQDLPQGSSGFVVMVTKKVNETVLQFDRQTALMYSVIIVVGFTILKNLFIYLSLRVLNPLRNAVIRTIRDDMFVKSLSLPIGFFNEERKGKLMSHITNDVNEIEVSVMSVIETVIREPITIVFTLITMLTISPELTLFLLLFLPVAGFLIGKVGRSLKKPSNQAQEQLGEMMSIIDETYSGMRIVKAFNAERHRLLGFRKINNILFRVRNKISARRDAGSPLSETLGIIVVGVILLYGGWLIFNNKSSLTGPAFIAFIGLFYTIINPLKNLSSALYNIQKGRAALDRVQGFLDTENTIQENTNPISKDSFDNAIVLKNVNFSFGDKKILSNINLEIPKGKTIALVGASGAGKSTLADLIPRFHDVDSGSIMIDGVDIKDLKLSSLRKLLGIVSQEPVLFNDTIYNNIILGTGGTTLAQVQEAASIANAHEFILKKENGYDTITGDRGVKLSGGERQRVTIARAVLKNPPILILDEATSSLDTESERVVQDAIVNLMKNRTSIIIAHRLSTIRYADEIIVLDKGQIVERGTHDELITLQGFYKKLVTMQELK